MNEITRIEDPAPAEIMIFGELDVLRALCLDQPTAEPLDPEDRLRFLFVIGQLDETIRILDSTMERMA